MTLVNIRAQSLGGKFLGKAVLATPPLLQTSAGTIVQQFTTANSGIVMDDPGSNTSPHPIDVVPNSRPTVYRPGKHYVEPSTKGGDSVAIVDLPLTASPVNYTFTVTAYNSGQISPASAVTRSVTVPLSLNSPQLDLVGVVVLLPGLRITDVTARVLDDGTSVSANVAMMCGCMITPLAAEPQEAFWPDIEFDVTASVSGLPPVRLQCTGTSLFTGTIPSTLMGQAVTITAQQLNQPQNRNVVTATVTAP